MRRILISQSCKDWGAKKHYVLGDGSCWSRATWQCALSQVLDDQGTFDKFVKQISSPKPRYTIPENLAKETIHILHQLKDMPDKNGRIKYLNHVNVDDTLIFFMRHVAAEYMKNEQFGLVRSPGDFNDIKTNKNRYGGPEIIAFMRYFTLEIHSISKNDRGLWRYQHTKTDGTTETINLENNKQPLPIIHNCVYSASNAHYEFISFARETSMSTEVADHIQSDYDLAVKTQKKYDELYKVEKGDLKLAEELQAAFQNEVEQDDGDYQLALKLVQEESKENAEEVKPVVNEVEDAQEAKPQQPSRKPAEKENVAPKPAVVDPDTKQKKISEVLLNAKNLTDFKKKHPIRALVAKFLHHTYVAKDKGEVVLDFAMRMKVRKFLKAEGVKVGVFDFATDKLKEYSENTKVN